MSINDTDFHIGSELMQGIVSKTVSKTLAVGKRLAKLSPITLLTLTGVLITRISGFAAYPFLVLHATEAFALSPVAAGSLVAIPPLISMLLSIPFGTLAEIVGKKWAMVASSLLAALAYFAIAGASSSIMLYVAVILLGLYRASFDPASMALLGEMARREDKGFVYAARYTAINIGAVLGPVIGVALASRHSSLQFAAAAGGYLIYAMVLLLVILKSHYLSTRALIHSNRLPDGNKNPPCHDGDKADTTSGFDQLMLRITSTLAVVIRDKNLLAYVVFITLIATIESQTETTLPIFLVKTFYYDFAITFYSSLLILKAILVMALQPFALKIFMQFGAKRVFIASGFLHAASMLLYGLGPSSGLLVFIGGMCLLSLGEVILGVGEGIFIDQIAPSKMASTYFGAVALGNLGAVTGPILGGFLMNSIGGPFTFMSLALLPLLGTFLLFYTKREMR
jgi:MFS family permease